MDVELPEVGVHDRVRVDVVDYPGAVSGSATGSVLLAPPPPGVPWRPEEAPVVDAWYAEEAAEAVALDPWHAAGFRGQGVRIAVFDVQWFNAELLAEELGDHQTHDCELTRSCDVPMDTLRPRYSFEEGAHGVACAEVVHDLAPDAELHLVRVDGPTSLENAADWAVRNDIDLVSMSMSFFNNSFYDGSGTVADAAGHMAEGGTLLVTSAGNYATEHWVGEWSDPDQDGWMDFPWGSSYLPVYFGAGAGLGYVTWDEFSRCGRNDFDVYAVNRDGEWVGASEGVQDADADACTPLERIGLRTDEEDWYWLRIRRKAGAGGVRVAVLARGGTVYDAQPGGLADPASSMAPWVVGAVRASEYAFGAPEFFSSYGPTHGGFYKPDVAGPDGLSSRVFGTTGFYGTSAATPAVAGTLAVLMSARPDLDARAAADLLGANALDARSPGMPPDPGVGVGRVRLWDLADEGAPGCEAGGGAMIAAPLLWWGRFRRRSACPR